MLKQLTTIIAFSCVSGVQPQIANRRGFRAIEQDKPSPTSPSGLGTRDEAETISPEQLAKEGYQEFDVQKSEESNEFARVDCSKSTGKCYHLDSGNLYLDAEKDIHDYREIDARRYQQWNSGGNTKYNIGNPVINLDMSQITDIAKKHASDTVDEHATRFYILIPSIIFGVFSLIALSIVVKKKARVNLGAKSEQKKALDEALGIMKKEIESNPTHAVKLIQYLKRLYPLEDLGHMILERELEESAHLMAGKRQKEAESRQIVKKHFSDGVV